MTGRRVRPTSGEPRPRAWVGRPDLHERFRQVVTRGLERAEREEAERLGRLRPGRRGRR